MKGAGQFPVALEVTLASARGFCAGVDRAIEIVERVLELHGAPIYVRHEVVHNRFVVGELRAKGVIFVDELSEVPRGSCVIFSAHGVSCKVQREAEQLSLVVFDATCPLVTKVHSEVVRYGREGRTVILVGHSGHPEVEGTLGRAIGKIHLVESIADVEALALNDSDGLAYVTQTTLSVDDTTAIVALLKHRFPGIEGPRRDDICYATQNRQTAVKKLARECDVVIVVGSVNSSNSTRLREIAEKCGAQAHMIDSAADIRTDWFDGKTRVGITAGASAPEVLVTEVIEILESMGAHICGEEGKIVEGVSFSLPPGLRRDDVP
ncbi:MAG: 4-hydroxy-3-methylbut-2-enyl diphosphate reductase [Pseudomonadota bacterium]|nr:4-hydroxy-3-methylbut-2-enyl diphosphate reductase [Pseudomonadota bacterium]